MLVTPASSLSLTLRQHSSTAQWQQQQQQQQQQSNGVDNDTIELLRIEDHIDQLSEIPLADVRNFCIIAHVDHGKSSLASRILEYTGNLGTEKQTLALRMGSASGRRMKDGHNNDDDDDGHVNYGEDLERQDGNTTTTLSSASEITMTSKTTTTNQEDDNNDEGEKEEIFILDTLAVERERGITVKATCASMLYKHTSSSTNDKGWILLQMVDTPGHVDFGMEVSKSLDSVEGAILLFDSARGIQAQTLSVYDKACRIGKQRDFIANVRNNSSSGKSGVGDGENIGGNDDQEGMRRNGGMGGIRILPALTKVDMPSARPLEVALAVSDLMGFDPDDILKTSARSRIGIKKILDTICTKVHPPAPLHDDDGVILRAKVIDSWFETKRGVIALVRVLSGTMSENDRIQIIEPESYEQIIANKERQGKEDEEGGDDGAEVNLNRHTVRKDTYSVQEVGMMMPHRIRTGMLTRGQMGYVIAGLRDPRDARPGAILSLQKHLPAIIGKDMVLPPSVSMGSHSVLYASVHPLEGDGFDELFAAVNRLALSDAGLEIQQTAGSSSGSGGGPFLGPGLRVGFQGLLHVEVFRQRLEDEFDLEAIVTPPKVPYVIQYLPSKNLHRAADLPTEEVIEDLIMWPEQGQRFKVLEPMVGIRVLAPMEYAGSIMDLIKRKRGTKLETKPVDEHTWQITSDMPWAEVVTDFHDELKSLSTGYASFDVSEANPSQQESNLCKVDIMLNSEVVDPLSFVCHVDVARTQARVVCEKLQEVLPRQQFVTVIQAKADGKIIASERIKAYRKDVLTKSGKTVGGGDVTRKKKLLEKQKQGKKRQQSTGKVTLSQEAFRAVISRNGS
jgi:GTP-binding protein LepA